jgi:PAS domain-containing protein
MDMLGLSQQILEQASVGFFQVTKDGKLVVANQALVHMLGFASVDELPGTKGSA